MQVMRGKDLRYVGVRLVDGRTVVVVEEYGCRVPLTHVMIHSQEGMDWSELSGATDLAHSILANWLELKRVSAALYQSFRRSVVDQFDRKGFILSSVALQNWLNERWSSMDHEEIQADLATDLDLMMVD